MKLTLFCVALTLQVIGLLALFLTRKIESFRFWPPPTGTSWQSLFVRSSFIFIVILGFVVGWMDYGTLDWPFAYAFSGGLFLIIVGSCLVILGIADLGYEDFAGTGNDLRTEGLYAYTRNPQYLGHIIAIAGWILIFRSTLMFILGLGVMSLLFYVPWVEEDYLVKEFGKDYESYMEEVPRFF